MADEIRRRSHSLFREAMELAPLERVEFVERACGDNPRLLRQVRRLMDALDTSVGFLERPALEQRRREAMDPLAQVASRIEGYRILGVIGSGGMATVYEAVQEATNRCVALKVLRHGLTHTDSLQRFRFETEVLARLKHPNIAEIYDAGAYDGGGGGRIPFFAMEHIHDARTIADFADERALGLRERLAIVAEVCDAVQHGHQNGVIHRDLKPSNVLVDASGRPRVIDFGVARSTDPDQTLITKQSDLHALIGTLHYMSPEQCAGRRVDVRADVYSLGVMLYELATGVLPHRLSGVPLPEALRMIQEETPRRPSAIDPQLRGDVEAIILMAIDKDPERRYRTAAALASDIRRHLRYETIEARPLTLRYQCRLFARRNRALVNAGAAVAAALLIGLTLTSVFAWRATREAERRRVAETVAIADRDRALWQAYVANIAAAISGFQSGEFAIMRRRLADAPAAHRGWEWRFLSSLADRSIQTVAAHDDMVFGSDLSPDGARFVTVSRDGAVRVWDAATLELLAETPPTGIALYAVAFEPSGERFVTGADDGQVVVWDAATAQRVATLAMLHRPVMSVAVSPRGIVAAASPGAPMVLIDPASGAGAAELDGADYAADGVAFSPDGRTLVSWDARGRVVVRDGATGAPRRTLAFDGECLSATFSPDGRLLAVGGEGGMAQVWAHSTGELLHSLHLDGTTSGVRALAFSPDGSLLASGQTDRGIVLWRLPEGEQGPLRRGHTEAVSGVRFTPSGDRLLSASWDRTIRVWAIGDDGPDELIRRLVAEPERAINVAFSPDDSLLATTGLSGVVRLWDPTLAEPLGELRGHQDAVYAIAFSPDGEWIATGSHDRSVRIWSARTGALAHELEGHTDAVWSVAFSPDGSRLASAGTDATIRLWDVASGVEVGVLRGHTERVIDIAFSPDGTRIASSSRDHTVRVWNAESGDAIHVLTGHTSDVFAVVYSLDGGQLYSGSRDQSVRVWDAYEGTLLDVLDGHGQFVTSLSMSPDGQRLAAGSWFGEVLFWDLPSRAVVASFKGHEDAIRALAFDHQARRLATASHDGTIRIFDEIPERERLSERDSARARVIEAERHAGRLIDAAGAYDAASREADFDASIGDDLRPVIRRAILRRSLAAPTAARSG